MKWACLFAALCLASVLFWPRPQAEVQNIPPQVADNVAQVELQADREALRDTVRDTVWRVIRKAAGVRVDTVLKTETDTFNMIVMVTDSALTCRKSRDSLLRVDSARKAQIEAMTCPAASEWRGYAMFAGGTVLGYLIGNLK